MGPIQQSLNSIATTAMDAVRTKEALASQHEREQREAAEKDFNARVTQQEQAYLSGDITREQLDRDVDKELFGSREQLLNQKRISDAVNKRTMEIQINNPELLGNMSKEEERDFINEQFDKAGDDLLIHGPDRFKSQETYMLSRVFEKLQDTEKLSKMRNVQGADILRNMQDMVKGNQYAQQAAIQLSDKIDTALNHMQSRKRWR